MSTRYSLISPEGKKCGSYQSVENAKRAGRKRWPEAPCDDRNEDPSAWDVWVPESPLSAS